MTNHELVDHLIYGVPNLAVGIAEMEATLGLRAAPGGAHPGSVTANATISLGGDAYLEILGPAGSPVAGRALPFWLHELPQGALVGWVHRTDDIHRAVTQARAAGYDLGDPVPMARRAGSDGDELSWLISTNRVPDPREPTFPLLIEWTGGRHPSGEGLGQAVLRGFELQHPDPAALSGAFEAVGVTGVAIGTGPASIRATIECPLGLVEIA